MLLHPAPKEFQRIRRKAHDETSDPMGPVWIDRSGDSGGLSGRTVVLPKENKDEYLAFARRIVDSLEPRTPVERERGQFIADQYWRLRRAKAIEDELLERFAYSAQELEEEIGRREVRLVGILAAEWDYDRAK
jgi:hypothetical protein